MTCGAGIPIFRIPCADLFDGIFETILTKLRMLAVLKLVVHFVELFAPDGLFPGGFASKLISFTPGFSPVESFRISGTVFNGFLL
jgi:hypothetical protein